MNARAIATARPLDRTLEESLARPLPAGAFADYLALAKPRVVVMILLTTAAGFLLGSHEPPDAAGMLLLLRTLLGTGLVAGGTLALNQYLERDIDARMKRTCRRPLPDGRLRPAEALAFGGAIAGAGLLILTFTVDPVSAMVTALTVILYLFAYTPMKTRSALCTVVGAFPGALPPVTGWTAAGGHLDLGAAILFGILFFWQLPHSLAIAHLYREDYDRAGVRLLPTVDRDGGSTGRQAVLNAMALLAVGMMPTAAGLAGAASFVVAAALGACILWQSLALAGTGTAASARRLLLATYAYIPFVLITMAVEGSWT